MNETPKKVIDGGQKCFLCSESATSNNRVFIFGKSGLDIAYLIKESTTVDANSYSDSDDLFICKKMCYKRLLRLKNAIDKCKGIKSEIKDKFVPMRTKRMQRPDNIEHEVEDTTQSRRVEQRSWCKASKSLEFSDARNTISPVLVAHTSPSETYQRLKQSLPPSRNPCPWYNFNRPDIYRGLHINILNANTRVPFAEYPPISPVTTSEFTREGSRLTDDSVSLLNLPITSSPIASSTKSTRDVHTDSSSGCVNITVKYPSKTVSKTVDDAYKTIGKALLHGSPSRIATAVMKCAPIRALVIEKVLDIVSKEVAELCSRKKPSLLRQTKKDDLVKFSLDQLCEEWKRMAPLFYSFLVVSSARKSTRNTSWLPSVAVSGSVLLNQRNHEMSATAYVLGILLKSRSTEVSKQYNNAFKNHEAFFYL